MKLGRRMVVSIVLAVIGVVLFIGGILGWVDSFWSGMGGGFLAVSLLQFIRFGRWERDPEYRQKMEVERKDERNRFLAERAWAWAGYLFVIIAALATLVLKLLGQETWSSAASMALCLLLTLYWVSYLIVRKKY